MATKPKFNRVSISYIGMELVLSTGKVLKGKYQSLIQVWNLEDIPNPNEPDVYQSLI